MDDSCVKYPPNYITIAHLKQQWLQHKQQNEQYPLAQKGKGLVGKAHFKLKEVEDGTRGKASNKKKMKYFVKKEARVETDVGEEEMMGVGRESYKEVAEEVGNVCMVEVVGESNVNRVGFRGKKQSWRKMGGGVGQSHSNGEKEKVRMGGAYGDKEVVGEYCNVYRKIEGKNCGVGFKGNKYNNRRRMGDWVGQVSDKGDTMGKSGQECNAGKEKVSVDEEVKVSGAYSGDKAMEEVDTVCLVKEVVGEHKLDREVTGKKCRVGFKGKKNRRRRMDDGVGKVSDKMDSGDQSGKQYNADKEEVSVDMKGRTNEKVKVSGAFHAYGDKEVEEVATVCTVEVVGENKLDKEIAGQKCRVGFRRKKSGWRRMGDGVGQVCDKADKAESVEQSGQEHNAEKEEVLVDVKERTNEKVRGRDAFCAYGVKSRDVPLVESETGLKMKIERNLGDLSLSDRRYGYGRSSVGVYDNKWRYGNSRRYEPWKMVKQRDNVFEWVKKGESSNANIAET